MASPTNKQQSVNTVLQDLMPLVQQCGRRWDFRSSFAKDAKEGSKSILRKRGLEAMLEEMSDLYNLECKKLKQGEALDDIITEKHGLVKAIVEEAEGVGYI
ncbi:unnamed protein product [Penicillium discolor]